MPVSQPLPDAPMSNTLQAFEATLPPAPQSVGSYVPAVRVGNLIFTSGTLPLHEGKLLHEGAVGGYALSLEEAQASARQCALNCLSVIKAEIGTLERVVRVVKVTGYISSAPVFFDQPKVLNGASDLLVEVFGERGKHARAAVGVSALPLNAPVEVEMIVEVE